MDDKGRGGLKRVEEPNRAAFTKFSSLPRSGDALKHLLRFLKRDHCPVEMLQPALLNNHGRNSDTDVQLIRLHGLQNHEQVIH